MIDRTLSEKSHGGGHFVSVVIPLYNKSRYIRRAIRSVLHQTFRDFELIVVDDGSTDDGDQIVERMSDPRIKLVRRPNGGQSAARNTGIRAARGELIAFLDADDEWDPEHLEALAKLMRCFPDAGLVATGYRSLYRDGLVVETTLGAKGVTRQALLLDNYFSVALRGSFITCSSLAIPRAVLKKAGVFREGEHIGADLDLWGRIALAWPVAFDCRVLATYHCDAQGRENPRRDRKLQLPPFALTVRGLFSKGQIRGSTMHEANEYVNLLWLQYADQAMRARDRRALKRAVREMAPTVVFRLQHFLLSLGAAVCPLPLLVLVRRVVTSRWGLFLRPKRCTLGVTRRIAGYAKQYAGQKV